jgi:hypothetical protein
MLVCGGRLVPEMQQMASTISDGCRDEAERSRHGPILRRALHDPTVLSELSDRDWGQLLGQARGAGLIPRLAHLLAGQPSIACPTPARRHLDGARRAADIAARDVRRDVQRVAAPLLLAGHRVILLKGAAYVIDDLPPAHGRTFGDLDLLVPRAVIADAEQRLSAAGWEPEELDPWDQRYYRAWMHEIPPLFHRESGAVADIHHTIVPVTARCRLNSALLFEAARPSRLDPRLHVLCPEDMVLHSSVHLFNDSEFDLALRNLTDLDLLLRHFGRESGFWQALLDRARMLDLERPLYYCLRYACRFLGTPVPAPTLSRVKGFAPAMPRLMDALFEQALRPRHRSCRDAGTGLALWLLFVRGHHLRLPPQLLVPHLLRKGYLRVLAAFQRETVAA